jgi:hypothetical protein
VRYRKTINRAKLRLLIGGTEAARWCVVVPVAILTMVLAIAEVWSEFLIEKIRHAMQRFHARMDWWKRPRPEPPRIRLVVDPDDDDDYLNVPMGLRR